LLLLGDPERPTFEPALREVTVIDLGQGDLEDLDRLLDQGLLLLEECERGSGVLHESRCPLEEGDRGREVFRRVLGVVVEVGQELVLVRVGLVGLQDLVRVGSVPKYVAATPDGRYVLVSNWCSYDLSVVSVAKGRQVRRVPLGPYPRGIAVDPAGRTAYVAVMGSADVAKVDLRTFRVRWLRGVGISPRHLVIDPAGRYLYATLNAEGRVAKVDLRSGRVVAKAATGNAPRSMAIAPDGRSLYVVNYESDTVAKVRTRDLRVLQTVRTNPDPIGITYDAATRQVRVACYSGSLMVFRDG